MGRFNHRSRRANKAKKVPGRAVAPGVLPNYVMAYDLMLPHQLGTMPPAVRNFLEQRNMLMVNKIACIPPSNINGYTVIIMDRAEFNLEYEWT